jgi:hypothetical protein
MALEVDGGGMKIKIQITIESDEGKPEALQEVAQLNRASLRPESLGLRSPDVPEPAGRASSGLVPHHDEADGDGSDGQEHQYK